MQGVLAILDEVVKRNPIDKQRVYVTGISLGGRGTWDIAQRMPDKFAAVAPICNGGYEKYAARLVGVPVWAWHGDADDVIPVERSRGMIAAIEKAGGKPKYTELKGVGHDSWTAAYTGPDNLLPWMFEQVKPRQAGGRQGQKSPLTSPQSKRWPFPLPAGALRTDRSFPELSRLGRRPRPRHATSFRETAAAATRKCALARLESGTSSHTWLAKNPGQTAGWPSTRTNCS